MRGSILCYVGEEEAMNIKISDRRRVPEEEGVSDLYGSKIPILKSFG